MTTIAVVVSNPADRSAIAEFVSSSLNAAVAFRDSVADAIKQSHTFSGIIAGDDDFRSALKDPSSNEVIYGATLFRLADKLFYKINLLPSSRDDRSRKNLAVDFHISAIMAEYGLRRGTLGHACIRECVKECLYLDEPKHKLSKAVYPAVAKRLDIRPDNVERAIRNAIHTADSDPISHDRLRALIGHVRPSNSEIIAALVQKIGESMLADKTY